MDLAYKGLRLVTALRWYLHTDQADSLLLERGIFTAPEYRPPEKTLRVSFCPRWERRTFGIGHDRAQMPAMLAFQAWKKTPRCSAPDRGGIRCALSPFECTATVVTAGTLPLRQRAFSMTVSVNAGASRGTDQSLHGVLATPDSPAPLDRLRSMDPGHELRYHCWRPPQCQIT